MGFLFCFLKRDIPQPSLGPVASSLPPSISPHVSYTHIVIRYRDLIYRHLNLSQRRPLEGVPDYPASCYICAFMTWPIQHSAQSSINDFILKVPANFTQFDINN